MLDSQNIGPTTVAEREWLELPEDDKRLVLMYLLDKEKEEAERLRGLLSAANLKFYRREEEIFQIVADYDEGCDDGKVRFLEALGIEIPQKQVTVEVTVDIGYFTEVDDSDYTASNIATEVAGYFEDGEVSDYNITFNEG